MSDRPTASDALRRRTVKAVALALLAADVARDGRISTWEQEHLPAPPAGAGIWPVITEAGGGRTAMTVVTGVAVALSMRRHGSATRPLVAVGAGIAIRAGVMLLVARPRPPRERWRVQPTGASFPSRHATWCALALFALRDQLPGSPAVRTAIPAIVLVECWSRLRLGVHWPTDVAAGVLLADLVVDLALHPSGAS